MVPKSKHPGTRYFPGKNDIFRSDPKHSGRLLRFVGGLRTQQRTCPTLGKAESDLAATQEIQMRILPQPTYFLPTPPTKSDEPGCQVIHGKRDKMRK